MCNLLKFWISTQEHQVKKKATNKQEIIIIIMIIIIEWENNEWINIKCNAPSTKLAVNALIRDKKEPAYPTTCKHFDEKQMHPLKTNGLCSRNKTVNQINEKRVVAQQEYKVLPYDCQ